MKTKTDDESEQQAAKQSPQGVEHVQIGDPGHAAPQVGIGGWQVPRPGVKEARKRQTNILTIDDMEKLGMGSLLGVAQGSAFKPYLAIMTWDGGKKGDKPVAFVGKGVTFDTGGISMKGNEVFKMAVNTLGRIVDETLQHNNMQKSDIDWLVPHQANIRIINATAKKLSMSLDRVVVTVDKHGNTSAASVPLALDVAVRDGRIKKGEILMLEAFGGGFTWGSVLLKF